MGEKPTKDEEGRKRSEDEDGGISTGMSMCYFLLVLFAVTVVALILLPGHLSPGPNDFRIRTIGRGLNGRITDERGFHFDPVYFSDIRGMEECKMELMEVVDFFHNPERYASLGARMPKGVLLHGSPGTGKTMLARAVATESNVTSFITASGSEFVEVYVGQGARRIRELFEFARQNLPAIIFIDELDAVGGRRGGGGGDSPMGGTSHREQDQTLNQLLVEMDGFSPMANLPLVVVGATNRIDVLDPALLRPGRFDRLVQVPLPDIAARVDILKHYLRGIKADGEVTEDAAVEDIARATTGFSGADLSNVVNEAALQAARQKFPRVTIQNINDARDRVAIGPERRSTAMSKAQRDVTAYHEAGHALVAYRLQPHTDPILKASIIQRGASLGHVEQVPVEDRHTIRLSEAKARLAVALGGRAAELETFGQEFVTSGASSDFRHATKLAQKMVGDWGMSDKVGPYYLPMGGNMMTAGVVSDRLISLADAEVRRLLGEAQDTAQTIIRKDGPYLRKIAEALLQRESLSGEEVHRLMLEPL